MIKNTILGLALVFLLYLSCQTLIYLEPMSPKPYHIGLQIRLHKILDNQDLPIYRFEVFEDGTFSLYLSRVRESNKDVKNLNFLRSLPCSELTLHNTTVNDLTPLLQCPLKKLELDDNYDLLDFSPISKMRLESFALEVRFLEKGNSFDLSVLSSQPLKSLTLVGGRFFNINSINWDNLDSLELREVKGIDSIGFLSASNLKSLTITDCGLTDISPLANVPLKNLELDRTKVSTIATLSKRRLERLSMWMTPAESLEPLVGQPLQYLQIGRTKIKDLTPLSSTPIETLFTDETMVKDVVPLGRTPLKFLSITQTQVYDLAILKEMKVRTLILDPIPLEKNMNTLKALKSLRRIGYDYPGQPKMLFWFRKKLGAD